MPDLNAGKGAAVRILTEKYKDCEAWLDTGRKKTKCKTPVIIQDEKEGGLKSTRICNKNLADPYTPPETYEEAAFQQKPELDLLADKLAKKLAACNISRGDSIVDILMAKLDRANAMQMAKGSRARWEHIDWDWSNEDPSDTDI